MTTCAVCGRLTRYIDRKTGEYLCGAHCGIARTPDEPSKRPPVKPMPDPRWVALEAALTWNYGAERAKAILAGDDEATQRDQFLWRRLGAVFNYGRFQ